MTKAGAPFMCSYCVCACILNRYMCVAIGRLTQTQTHSKCKHGDTTPQQYRIDSLTQCKRIKGAPALTNISTFHLRPYYMC